MSDNQNNDLINSLIGGMNKAFSDIAKALETLANSASSSGKPRKPNPEAEEERKRRKAEAEARKKAEAEARATERQRRAEEAAARRKAEAETKEAERQRRVEEARARREAERQRRAEEAAARRAEVAAQREEEKRKKAEEAAKLKEAQKQQKEHEDALNEAEKEQKKKEDNIKRSQEKFAGYGDKIAFGALNKVISIATRELKDKFNKLTDILTSSGDKIASAASMMGEAFDNIAKKSADAVEESAKQEAVEAEDISFLENPLAWLVAEWSRVKGNYAKSKLKESDAKLGNLGISDATRLALTSALMSKYTNVGYSGDSLANLVGGTEATLLRLAKLNNISNAEAFNIGTSGKYEQLGAAGENSLAFKGYLYNHGLLKDYMNDAQIAGKYAEYLSEISLKKSVTDIALYNAELAKTGMIADQVGKNLYEFDEVINQTAKDMNIPEYGYDEQSQSIENVDDKTKKLKKDYGDVWDLFKTFMGSRADMVLYLQQKGYSLNEAERIIDEIFGQKNKEVQFSLWLKYASNNGYTLDHVKEVLDDIANYSGQSFDILLNLAPSSYDTISILSEVYNVWKALNQPVSLKLNWGDIGDLEPAANGVTFRTHEDEEREVTNRIVAENLAKEKETDTDIVPDDTDPYADRIRGEQGEFGYLRDQKDVELLLGLGYSKEEIADFWINGITPEAFDRLETERSLDSWATGLENVNNVLKWFAAAPYLGLAGLTSYELLSLLGISSVGDLAFGGAFASGGIISDDMLIRAGEGGNSEAVIPLDTQGGIDYLASALQEAGASGSTIVNVNLSGQLLEMNDYSVRRLGEKLASIIDNETNRRGALNYGNQN